MSFYMDSDRGNVRQNNEDSFLFEQFEKLNILILADGVGGHEDGEIASGYAVNIVMEYIKSKWRKFSFLQFSFLLKLSPSYLLCEIYL